MNDLKLADFLLKDVGGIDNLQDGYSETLQEFWDATIEPLLPQKETVERLMNMLIRYCDEPDAVFAIRAFADWKPDLVEPDKKNIDIEGNSTLRRGFLSHTNLGFSFFYTDNYFALYFMKMALNDFVPDYEEFKSMMLTHSFPGKCGPYDSKYEAKKAAYDITGKKGKDPGYGAAGYKLSHIFDAGQGYWLADIGKCVGMAAMCEEFFPRGNYEDWKQENDAGDYLRYVNIDENRAPFIKRWLKAEFLRFTCPLNYVLTPKVGSNRCQESPIRFYKNDIGEDSRFQQYAMLRCSQKYGDVFEKYISHLMLEPGVNGKDYGEEIIKLTYGWSLGEENKKKGMLTKDNIEAVLGFMISHQEHGLAYHMSDLVDEYYCEDIIGISKAALIEGADGNVSIRKKWSVKDVNKMKQWLIGELGFDADGLAEVVHECKLQSGAKK